MRGHQRVIRLVARSSPCNKGFAHVSNIGGEATYACVALGTTMPAVHEALLCILTIDFCEAVVHGVPRKVKEQIGLTLFDSRPTCIPQPDRMWVMTP